jgi:hypothetical protein
MARVELPREENRGRLQNLVGLLEISHFPLKVLDPLLLSTCDTRPLGGIHLGLQHQRRSDSAPIPTFGPIAWQAAYTDRYSSR